MSAVKSWPFFKIKESIFAGKSIEVYICTKKFYKCLHIQRYVCTIMKWRRRWKFKFVVQSLKKNILNLKVLIFFQNGLQKVYRIKLVLSVYLCATVHHYLNQNSNRYIQSGSLRSTRTNRKDQLWAKWPNYLSLLLVMHTNNNFTTKSTLLTLY